MTSTRAKGGGMNVTKVSVGITTIIGYLTMIGSAIPTVIKTLESGNAALGKPEAALALLGIVVGGITTLVRGLQGAAKAHAAIKAGAPGDVR